MYKSINPAVLYGTCISSLIVCSTHNHKILKKH